MAQWIFPIPKRCRKMVRPHENVPYIIGIHTKWFCFLMKLLCCSHVHVMLLATTAYTVCILGVILMYIWYVPDPSCLLNIFFITWTLFLIQLMTSISLHPKVSHFGFRGSLNSISSVICVCGFFENRSFYLHSNRWMLDSWLQRLWGFTLCLFAGAPFEGMFHLI